MRISDWSSDVCSSDLKKKAPPQKTASRTSMPQASGVIVSPLPFSIARLRRDCRWAAALCCQHAPQLRNGGMRGGEDRAAGHRRDLARHEPHRELAQHQAVAVGDARSEEHTSELQSLMSPSY